MYKRADTEDFERYLQGVVILDGDGIVRLDDEDPVHVGIVHDSSGYNPGAAIFVDQNRYHATQDTVIQEAYDILFHKDMENEEHVKELQEEWGDRWDEILTEAYDGKAWTMTIQEFAEIFNKHPDIFKKTQIAVWDDDEEEENV